MAAEGTASPAPPSPRATCLRGGAGRGPARFRSAPRPGSVELGRARERLPPGAALPGGEHDPGGERRGGEREGQGARPGARAARRQAAHRPRRRARVPAGGEAGER